MRTSPLASGASTAARAVSCWHILLGNHGRSRQSASVYSRMLARGFSSLVQHRYAIQVHGNSAQGAVIATYMLDKRQRQLLTCCLHAALLSCSSPVEQPLVHSITGLCTCRSSYTATTCSQHDILSTSCTISQQWWTCQHYTGSGAS